MHLSKAISARSERWSETLGTRPSNVCLHHSGQGGENLFFYWSYKPISEKQLADMTIKAFYSEIAVYDFSHPGFRKAASHFTEMVWRSVTEIGVGLYTNIFNERHGNCNIGTRRPAYGYFVTVQHEPHGNIDGALHFVRNVLRPQSNSRLL